MWAFGFTYRVTQYIVWPIEPDVLHQHQPLIGGLLHNRVTDNRRIDPVRQWLCAKHCRDQAAQQREAEQSQWGDTRLHG